MKKFFKTGDLFIWLTGMGLGISLIMISGLLVLILMNGKDYFWASEIIEVTKKDGSKVFGNQISKEIVPLLNLPDSLKDKDINRIQLKIGNRDLYGFDFEWIDERDISKINLPDYAATIERMEFGNFYGQITEILVEGNATVRGH